MVVEADLYKFIA